MTGHMTDLGYMSEKGHMIEIDHVTKKCHKIKTGHMTVHDGGKLKLVK